MGNVLFALLGNFGYLDQKIILGPYFYVLLDLVHLIFPIGPTCEEAENQNLKCRSITE